MVYYKPIHRLNNRLWLDAPTAIVKIRLDTEKPDAHNDGGAKIVAPTSRRMLIHRETLGVPGFVSIIQIKKLMLWGCARLATGKNAGKKERIKGKLKHFFSN